MKKPLTVNEFASLGGKARWKGKNKKQRSEAMKRIRKGLSPHASTDESLQASV